MFWETNFNPISSSKTETFAPVRRGSVSWRHDSYATVAFNVVVNINGTVPREINKYHGTCKRLTESRLNLLQITDWVTSVTGYVCGGGVTHLRIIYTAARHQICYCCNGTFVHGQLVGAVGKVVPVGSSGTSWAEGNEMTLCMTGGDGGGGWAGFVMTDGFASWLKADGIKSASSDGTR